MLGMFTTPLHSVFVLLTPPGLDLRPGQVFEQRFAAGLAGQSVVRLPIRIDISTGLTRYRDSDFKQPFLSGFGGGSRRVREHMPNNACRGPPAERDRINVAD